VNTYAGLANKNAVLYPYIIDIFSGIVMAEPSTTGQVKVPDPDRDTWTTAQRGAYITWYINTYGNPNRNWDDYDIHHVLPLAYGGTSSNSNLIPLLRPVHQQVVNTWWLGF
jgi:hypothetical protein